MRLRVHGHVERVSAYDLVEMGRGEDAWVHERVHAVDDELRALEAHHGELALAVGEPGEERQAERFALHGGW